MSVYIVAYNSIIPALLTEEPDYKVYIPDSGARRRMSRAVKMGVASALQCLENSAVNPDAIITATGLGCLADTEKFLKTVIENKEDLLNPTPFIQSTFNTVGSQIAIALKNKCYNNTYSHRGCAFETALTDGIMKLLEGEAKYVLAGSYEEITDTSLNILTRLGHFRKGGKAGEGATFFILSSETHSSCLLKDISLVFNPDTEEITDKMTAFWAKNRLKSEDIDLLISGESGNSEEQPFYDKIEKALSSASVAHFKHITGDYQTASSFALHLAAEVAKSGVIPAKFIKNDKHKNIRKILIYNHYRCINHSFMLIDCCPHK
ncbi:MAG: beta-ketoacyl synthase chain length factor [Dysgonamonadaceae bacterium]|jgi:hypothetical protein|nr:beta-ketoacyl synthase chain length factor [Dysgonamonadaceae bacterium]